MNMEMMRNKFNTYYFSAKKRVDTADRSLVLLMTPAMGLILFGLLAVLAPKLILSLIALFCVFFGGLFGFAAYKIWKLKSKFEKAAKNYHGRVIVQGGEISNFETEVLFEDDEEDDLDITFH
ncbi:MAG: hypothetical protein R3A13_04540 [Bdellovibrionota bacterium]